jgi:hypothetical protein
MRRTKVIVDKANFAIASEVGVPCSDGLEQI